MNDAPEASPRRPVSARGNPLVRSSARWLQGIGVRPNAVSVASIFFAAGAGAAMAYSSESETRVALASLGIAVAGIALRGLCNVLDGLIAVEGAMQSASGAIYNEFPDRVSDTFLCLGAGYATNALAYGHELGWAAALLALMTAYTRVLGGSAGATQSFIGPMAKTHRMAVLAVACIAAGIERVATGTQWAFVWALGIIIAGCVVTVARRLSLVVRELESK